MQPPNLGNLKEYQEYLHSSPPAPQAALTHREVLTKATYDKWLIPVDGDPCKTNAPVGVALGTGAGWKVWKVEDLRVAYDADATEPNLWMVDFLKLYPGVAPVAGPLVIFEWHRSVRHIWSHVEMVLGRWAYRKMCKRWARRQTPTAKSNLEHSKDG